MVVETENKKSHRKRNEQIRDRKIYLQKPIKLSPSKSIPASNQSMVDRVIARAQNAKNNVVTTSLNTRQPSDRDQDFHSVYDTQTQPKQPRYRHQRANQVANLQGKAITNRSNQGNSDQNDLRMGYNTFQMQHQLSPQQSHISDAINPATIHVPTEKPIDSDGEVTTQAEQLLSQQSDTEPR